MNAVLVSVDPVSILWGVFLLFFPPLPPLLPPLSFSWSLSPGMGSIPTNPKKFPITLFLFSSFALLFPPPFLSSSNFFLLFSPAFLSPILSQSFLSFSSSCFLLTFPFCCFSFFLSPRSFILPISSSFPPPLSFSWFLFLFFLSRP